MRVCKIRHPTVQGVIAHVGMSFIHPTPSCTATLYQPCKTRAKAFFAKKATVCTLSEWAFANLFYLHTAVFIFFDAQVTQIPA